MQSAVAAPAAGPWWSRRVTRIAIAIAVLGLLSFFVDPREVVDILRRIPLATVALAIAILSLDRFLMGLKWRHLVVSAGAQLRLIDAVAMYYQSKFATLVFPAAFGGEVLRGVLGARAGVPSHVVVASMVVERVVAAISSLLLAGLGFSFLSGLASQARFGNTPALLVAVAGTALAAAAIVALHRPTHRLFGRLLGRWVPSPLFRLLDRLSSAVVRYRSAPGVLLANLVLTLIEHIVQMLALYVLASGLGVSLPFLEFMAATAIIMLVRRGAGFLEGWGIAESGVVMLYTIFGVGASRSAALAVALWAVSLLACLPGAYLLSRGAWRTTAVDVRKAA